MGEKHYQINYMKNKHPKIYAFIDSQNLNLGTCKDIRNKNGKLIYKGWKLDFKKFRIYLKDKFHVSKAFIFIGYMKENRYLYRSLERFGFELVYKATIKNGLGKAKGNVDAELVLHAAAIEFNNYDKAVIVSGDGDFCCLHEYLKSKNKLLNIVIPNPYSESSLLKLFQKYKIMLNREREKIEFKQ